jgi:hypothetical protein
MRNEIGLACLMSAEQGRSRAVARLLGRSSSFVYSLSSRTQIQHVKLD